VITKLSMVHNVINANLQILSSTKKREGFANRSNRQETVKTKNAQERQPKALWTPLIIIVQPSPVSGNLV